MQCCSCNSIAIGQEGGIAPLIALARVEAEVIFNLLKEILPCTPLIVQKMISFLFCNDPGIVL